MVYRIILLCQFWQIWLNWPLFSHSSKIDEFEKYLSKAELKFQKGDSLLIAKNLSGALQAYLAGRKILNDSFFALMMARHQDSLASDSITAHWESAVALMRDKLEAVDDCEFNRCYIYKEEKVANICLQIIQRNDSLAIANLMRELEQLFQLDENAHLKNFFGKIYDYVNLQYNLAAFHLAAFADSSFHKRQRSQFMKFKKMYRNYKIQLQQNKR